MRDAVAGSSGQLTDYPTYPFEILRASKSVDRLFLVFQDVVAFKLCRVPYTVEILPPFLPEMKEQKLTWASDIS